MSSYVISIKEFSEIRKLVTKRQQEIVTEIGNKKNITKNQCLKYIEELCDIVITYDPVLSLNDPSIQPIIKLVDMNNKQNGETITSTKDCNSLATLKTPQTQDIVVDDDVVEVIEDSDTSWVTPINTISTRSRSKPGVRYKGVIRGMDSLKCDDWSDDWSVAEEPKKSPIKKSRTTRSTNQSTSETTTIEDNTSEKEKSDNWSSIGQVLGGSSVCITVLSPEERRSLITKRVEERLQKETKRGSKGEVNLKARAMADINPGVDDSGNKLRWQY